MEKQRKVLVTTDNSLIYYEVSGQGFPLFFLHGNGGSGKYFAHQVPTFSRYYKVYIVDSRGHGRSTNQKNVLSFTQMADDLYEIMKQEGISQAHIIGFSDGANLAMVFCKQHPERVKKLVLNAGNTNVSGVIWPLRLLTIIENSFLTFFSLFSKKARKQLTIVQLLLQNIGVSTKDLQKIAAETLIIVGKYDVIKRSHSLYLAKEIPHASFVLISNQGHSFARKAPKLFNKEVLSFLKKK